MASHTDHKQTHTAVTQKLAEPTGSFSSLSYWAGWRSTRDTYIQCRSLQQLVSDSLPSNWSVDLSLPTCWHLDIWAPRIKTPLQLLIQIITHIHIQATNQDFLSASSQCSVLSHFLLLPDHLTHSPAAPAWSPLTVIYILAHPHLLLSLVPWKHGPSTHGLAPAAGIQTLICTDAHTTLT